MRRQNARGAAEQANGIQHLATGLLVLSVAERGKCQLLNRQVIASSVKAVANAVILTYVLRAPEPDGNIFQSKKLKERGKVLLD